MVRKKEYLAFISNTDLEREVGKVVDVAKKASEKADSMLYKNVIDPFSALFDSLCNGISLKQWIKQERSRQVQKTLQNALGDFHQGILGSFGEWENMGTGNVIDLCNHKKKLIAEVKNKFNTTKGNHKVSIYDDLKNGLKKYVEYTGYYVEVIPQRKLRYNKPFTPSDNNKFGKRRPRNTKIRVIDGQSFYDLASGTVGALKEVYSVLPDVINELTGKNIKSATTHEEFLDLFDRAF